MISWTRIWPSGYDLIFSTTVFLVTTKKNEKQAEKSFIGQWKTWAKVGYDFHTDHALTYELCFCLSLQEMCLSCAEQLIPTQIISTLSRLLTFAKSGTWPLWKCTHNNTWFLAQSLTHSGQVLGFMVQIRSLHKDKDHTKTAGFIFIFYMSFLHYRITESQNHRMSGVGMDLCGSSSPTPLPKQGHL